MFMVFLLCGLSKIGCLFTGVCLGCCFLLDCFMLISSVDLVLGCASGFGCDLFGCCYLVLLKFTDLMPGCCCTTLCCACI